MNNKIVNNKDNIENFCPTSRKRSSSKSFVKDAGWKLAKAENSPTSSSPLSNLEDMGVGMLESEDSSSSVVDAPKIQHIYYSTLSNVLRETTTDDANHHIQSVNGTDLKSNNNCAMEQKSWDNTNNSNMQGKSTVTMGLGMTSVQIPNFQTGLPTEKSIRSPLATVACNGVLRNVQRLKQQANVNVNVNDLQPSPHSLLLLLPSTSQQAALLSQKQKVQLQNQRFGQQQSKNFIPTEDFFLFRNQLTVKHENSKKDRFNELSDEIVLQIFKWLPKKTLLRCGRVCQRFNRCAADESLWTRLDLGGHCLKSGALENILKRGVVILRLAQAELNHPVFETRFLAEEPNFEAKLQYLDLSMATVTKPSLKMLLSRCRQLKKLSLEHVALNDDICTEISKNTNLEALNLAMCSGIEAWSVRKMLTALQQLCSLNISWTNLSVDAVTSLVTNITPNILRLNIAGCRKTMFDSHLASLAKRCPQLLELDLSDCTALTGNAICIICTFKELEYLSLSRCYSIGASAYIQLQSMPTLTYLDIFGMLTETALAVLRDTFGKISINKFIHSSVARPTVGTRRTSIWGLRTRDFHV